MAVRRRESIAAALTAGLVVLALLATGSPGRAGARGGDLKLKKIADLEAPVYVSDAPGASKLVVVVEQPGTIRVLRGGKLLRKPFLDLRNRVLYGGEQGLLSIAFDPKYAKNRRFFVYYVNRDGNISVDSLQRRQKSRTRARESSRRKVIEIPHPSFENHNGGQLQFGPDGKLYLATGDGGSEGDPKENAQNPESLLGKLLRIEPRRKRGHSSPGSNPFASGPGRNEIYALGLRNPYRFSFDSQTGDLWIGDVGQNEFEEIDHASLAAARGANFGWDLFEGNHEFEGNAQNPPPSYRAPVLEYSHGNSNCAITGGYVSRDPGVPALAGRYVYSDFCGGQIRSLDAGAANPAATDMATGLSVSSPSSFGEGSNGRLYVTSLNGPVYRIVEG